MTAIFFGSHLYNLITISGVLPQDREEIIKHLDSEMAAWDRDQPGFLDTDLEEDRYVEKIYDAE